MPHSPRTLLEWSYEPPEFFEEPVTLTIDDGTITVAQGKAEGHFDADRYALGHQFRDRIHETLTGYFMAQQVKVVSPFTLNSPSMCKVYPDGRRDVTMFVEACTIKITGGKVDFVITGPKGETKSDSKAERLQAQQVFRERVMKLYQSDLVLRRLLQVFNNAQKDPENKLIHLYEIRDCLANEFGGDAETRSALAISSADWSQFGRIANYEPVLEGRHRGKHLNLRPATAEEIDFCTNTAQRLIETYVSWKVAVSPP